MPKTQLSLFDVPSPLDRHHYELAAEPVEVRHLIDGMVDMLQRSIGPTIQITIRFQAGLPPVHTDRNQLELALVNLALNSRDAMPEGGELIIGARREAVIAGVQDLGPGDYICLSVADTVSSSLGSAIFPSACARSHPSSAVSAASCSGMISPAFPAEHDRSNGVDQAAVRQATRPVTLRAPRSASARRRRGPGHRPRPARRRR